jgi:ribosomal protein S17
MRLARKLGNENPTLRHHWRNPFRVAVHHLFLEHDTMKKHKILRVALRAKYGAHHYRITQNDMVHIYGVMPNSATVGWWLMGDILIAELWMGLA